MKYVIIGYGAAADAAATLLSKKAPNDEIIIFTDERIPFYYRPGLIDFIAGKSTEEKLIVHNEDWFKNTNIKIQLNTRVEKIDTENQTVTIEDGTKVPYDKLLLACGSKSRIPKIKNLENCTRVFKLKNIDDATAIVELATKSQKVIILGGGILGIETAAGLSARGLKTVVADISDRVLARQLDADGSIVIREMLAKKGIQFITGVAAEEITENEGKLTVKFNTGAQESADLCIISAGVIPENPILKGTEIKTDYGVIVDDHMETNIKNVYAAGDIAKHNGKLYGIWLPSKEQGEIAAYNMVGEVKKYTGTISNYNLKVAGIALSTIGTLNGTEHTIKRTADVYQKLFCDGKKIVGAILLGDNSKARQISAAIKARQSKSEIEAILR